MLTLVLKSSSAFYLLHLSIRKGKNRKTKKSISISKLVLLLAVKPSPYRLEFQFAFVPLIFSSGLQTSVFREMEMKNPHCDSGRLEFERQWRSPESLLLAASEKVRFDLSEDLSPEAEKSVNSFFALLP